MTIRDDLLFALEMGARFIETYDYPTWEVRATRVADIATARAWVLANAPRP